jgi:hypothetical protein
MRLPVALIVLTVACHSDPYTLPLYGANGALTSGEQVLLTYSDSSTSKYHFQFQAYQPSWAPNGSGILYGFSARPSQIVEVLGLRCSGPRVCVPAPVDSLDGCLGLLPPTGGSAYWNLCETEVTHADSTDIFTEGALNTAGQLLYIEMTGPTSLPSPIGFHAELWLGDPQRISSRRKVLTLYRDHLGVVDTTAGALNWLRDIQWLGTQAFFAIGQFKKPDNTDSTLGIIRGAITAGGADLAFVAGTTGPAARHFALIPGGTALVYVDTSALVKHVVVATGVKTILAALPIDTAGRAIDIGCRADACGILTYDGTPRHWDLWKVDLVSGGVTLVKTFTRTITGARLSPNSGDVLLVARDTLYLLPKAVP